jgi:predicted HTH transcriptional regulator
VAEAIVNAVAHRDYASHASVQVMLFADRLEVWNPGQLPPALTPEQLRLPHASIPRNPLLAEPLFLTRYIERAGTGTLDMIALCREAGLPEPEFRQDGGQFVLTLWRDWLTQDVLAGLGLNDRQMRAIALLKTQRRITTGEYQKWVQCPRRTAARDLDELVTKGVVQRVGSGRSTHYVPLEKRAINVPNVPSSPVAPQTTSLPATTAKQGAKGPSRKPGRKRATKGTKGTATTRRASKGNKRAKKK